MTKEEYIKFVDQETAKINGNLRELQGKIWLDKICDATTNHTRVIHKNIK